MIDRQHIGHRFAPFDTVVEAGRIRLFCKAIDETNPIHLDHEAAQHAGYRGIVAPLTFPTTLAADAPNPGAILELVGVDISLILHGGERYEYFAPMIAGDRITTEHGIVDIVSKKAGTLTFLIVESSMRNQLGELVCSARRSMLIRRPEAGDL